VVGRAPTTANGRTRTTTGSGRRVGVDAALIEPFVRPAPSARA
jgi:hypothetical protein